jgi:prefoldin subunit 5
VSESSPERRFASIVADSVNQVTSPLVKKIFELEKEQETLKAQLDKVTNEVIKGVIESSLDIALKKTTLDLTSKIDTITSSLVSIDAKLENLQKDITPETINELKNDLNEIKNNVSKIGIENINTEEITNALKEAVSQSIAGESNKFASKDEIIDLKNKIKELTVGLVNKLDALSKTVESTTESVANLKSDVSNIRPEIERIKDISSKITNIEFQFTNVIAKDLDEIKSTLSDLKNQGKRPSPPSQVSKPFGANVEVEGGANQ